MIHISRPRTMLTDYIGKPIQLYSKCSRVGMSMLSTRTNWHSVNGYGLFQGDWQKATIQITLVKRAYELGCSIKCT